MNSIKTFEAYLYDSLRGVVWPGHVEVYDKNYAYKTVNATFFGNDGHSFLVSENEGELYRGVFWLSNRYDDKANDIYSMYRLEKADELEAEYEKLASKMEDIQRKIDDARSSKRIWYKLGGDRRWADEGRGGL